MTAPLDVLVVGAGPTGLALAAQLRAYDIGFRIVDRSLDRVRESRALGIQPRTLEALAGFGVTERLVARGNPAMRLCLHLTRRTVSIPLFDIGLPDTPYPFLLFLSQAETEHILGEHLATRDVTVERGTELTGLERHGPHVVCRLRGRDGTTETVRARHVVGCDGAHSTVRAQAGIGFEGYAYPQTYLLADLDVEGLEPGAVHSYLSGGGMLFFFPLGSPAPWRMLAMRPSDAPDGEVTLPLLQGIADRYGAAGLVLRDPVWMTDFRLHNRGAVRYRSGPFFLAGDAAHIHPPAGGQGMNLGVQDAFNLGWKLAAQVHGWAPEALLDTYHAERHPVAEDVLTNTRAQVELAGTEPGPRAVRALFTELMDIAEVHRYLIEKITATGIRYDVGDGPDPLGRRLPDMDLTQGRLYDRLHRGRGLVLDRTERLTAAGWADRVDLVADPAAALDAPAVLLRPDGYVAWVGEDQQDLDDHLTRWFGRSGHRS